MFTLLSILHCQAKLFGFLSLSFLKVNISKFYFSTETSCRTLPCGGHWQISSALQHHSKAPSPIWSLSNELKDKITFSDKPETCWQLWWVCYLFHTLAGKAGGELAGHDCHDNRMPNQTSWCRIPLLKPTSDPSRLDELLKLQKT